MFIDENSSPLMKSAFEKGKQEGIKEGMERAADIAKNMEAEYSSVSWNNACLDVWRAIRKEIIG